MLFQLGQFYYEGKGVPRSFEKAVEWWRRAAARRVSDGMCRFALCLAKGEGQTFLSVLSILEMQLVNGTMLLARMCLPGLASRIHDLRHGGPAQTR